MENIKDHWEKVFATKAENEVSWFQPIPETSVNLLEECNPPMDGNIIDIGGGDSHFVDVLLDKGYKNIYALDISENAIERAKKRLGVRAEKVNWIVSDSSKFKPTIKFDFWHDRASFHFLTDEASISRYVEAVKNSINPKGHLVIGTFSEHGPKKCSMLDVKKYDETSMRETFKEAFDCNKCFKEDHRTPFDTIQNFIFCVFRKS